MAADWSKIVNYVVETTETKTYDISIVRYLIVNFGSGMIFFKQ
jgi:hypothetical protein